jgi:predicted PurR-regulated permease PerM
MQATLAGYRLTTRRILPEMPAPRPPSLQSPALAANASPAATGADAVTDVIVPPVTAVADAGTVPAGSSLLRRPLTLRNYIWIIGAALVLFFALRNLGPVLTPFLIGAILAYLGTPLVDWAEARNVSRNLATTVVVLLFGLLLLALFVVLVPLIQAEVTLAARRLPEVIGQSTARLVPWLQQQFGITLALDLASLKTLVNENMDEARDLSMHVLAGLRTGGLIVISVLVNVALIPVVMFYLLRDWNMIIERMDALVPRAWNAKVRQITSDIDRVLAEFLRGQVLVMIVLASFYAVGLSLVGLQHAVAIGLVTGLLVFIPYVGFGLGLVLGVLAALLQWTGWPGFLAVLAVYAVGQVLEAYVLVPLLVGDRIGLHPLAVIFALLAFGQLFGFAGVLLALPISAALLVGLRHLRAAYLQSPVYRGDT